LVEEEEEERAVRVVARCGEVGIELHLGIVRGLWMTRMRMRTTL